MKLRLSFKRKIWLALGVALAGFAALGGIAALALGSLTQTVAEADHLNRGAIAVSKAQIVLLQLSEDSRQVDTARLKEFLGRVDQEEQEIKTQLDSARTEVSGEIRQDLAGFAEQVTTYCSGIKAWLDKKAQFGFGAGDGQYAELDRVGAELQDLVGMLSSLLDPFKAARGYEREFFARRDESLLAKFQEASNQFKGKFETLGLQELSVKGGKPLSELYAKYRAVAQQTIATFQEIAALEAAQISTLAELNRRGGDIRERVLATLATARVDSQQAQRKTNWSLAGGGAVVVALLVAILTWVGMTTSRRIDRTCDLLEDMATGEGDLTRRLPQQFVSCSEVWNCEHRECPSHGENDACWSHVGSMQLGSDNIRCAQLQSGQVEDCSHCKVYAASRALEADEFDRLSHWFNTFLDRVRHLVAQVKDSSQQLASASEQLSTTTTQIASSGEEVSSQSQSVAGAAEEMTDTVHAVATNTTTANDASVKARETASAGAEVVAQAVAAMTNIAQVVEQAASTVNSLGAESEKIGVVLQVIEDIADQTNLLALNAAIEAARAGDHGRGFAVVADEVRKLAEKTVRATQEIGGTISSIQKESRRAVEGMGEGLQAVTSGRELGERAGRAIRDIQDQVAVASDETSQIATATEQLASTIREMAGSMEEIARGIEQNTTATLDISRTAQSVAGRADQLKVLTGKFRT